MDKRLEANLRVKGSITDALFALMQKKNLADITITEIINDAGVARASFYRNYKSKSDVIVVFIRDILERFRNGREITSINYRSRQHVKKFFLYFRTYSSYFINLYNANLISLLIDELNAFQAAMAGETAMSSPDKYCVYFYMGALFNVSFEWTRAGCVEPLDDMVDVFCKEMGIE